MPKICVPIVGKTKADILGAAEKICETPADLIEWRADWFEGVFDVEVVCGVLSELRDILGEIPLLFTFRTKGEGGEREVNRDTYMKLNEILIASGNIDLVDVEVFTVSVLWCT